MSASGDPEFRDDFERDVPLIHYGLGVLILLIGMTLRLVTYNRVGFVAESLRDVGSFLAVTVAVAFLYERVIHVRDRKIFLYDLDRLLERQLVGEQRGFKLFAAGRPPLEEKVAVLQAATHEVIEYGTALRTFTNYFETRPAAEYRGHIVALLKKGVHFKCLMIDPDWARVHGEEEEAAKAANSLAVLKRLAAEFSAAKYRGKFEIYLYAHYPLFASICVDPDAPNGRLFFTPYLYKRHRAEAPAFLISKVHRSEIFDKLAGSVKATLQEARLVAP